MSAAVIMHIIMQADYDVIEFHEPKSYREVWDLQKQINRDVYEGRCCESVIFVEHLPVYTLGVHGKIENVKVSVDEIGNGGAEVVRIERGGDVTFHGPGQLVVYPIIRLSDRPYGVKRYVEQLEDTVINVCKQYGIKTLRNPDAPGVWCDTVIPKKICALGLKVAHGVTMHGFALNISTDLKWFRNINPCGFSSSQVTSMAEQLGDREVPVFDEVKESVKRNLFSWL